jgi:N-acetylmuramoyl-L-alanine amidase
VRKAPFVVLIGASMPSVLAEIGFISNPHDEGSMKRPEYRDRIAEALYKGVTSYAGTLSHFQVAQRR